MQTNSKERLKSKDLMTSAIFSVLLSLVFFIGSMTLGMTPVTYPFLVAVMMIPGGIIWAYMRVKVPKRGSILIQCVLIALLMFIIGSGWWIALGFLLGGIAAELLTGIGSYRDFKTQTIGYMVFGVITNIACFCPILIAADYYYNYATTGGMDVGYMDTLMAFMSWPILLISSALSLVGGLIGMWLGKAMLKKHFVKAGIA